PLLPSSFTYTTLFRSIVDESGHIVTNHHVIANADSIRVQLEDGREADARIVGRDPDTDLAVLKIDLTQLPVASFGRSDQLLVGEDRKSTRLNSSHQII